MRWAIAAMVAFLLGLGGAGTAWYAVESSGRAAMAADGPPPAAHAYEEVLPPPVETSVFEVAPPPAVASAVPSATVAAPAAAHPRVTHGMTAPTPSSTPAPKPTDKSDVF